MTSIHISNELQIVIESMQEKKAEEVAVLELKTLTSFTNYFVICSGESEPQIKSIFRNVQERMSAIGIKPNHVEGRSDTGWILMDYDDFVVHIFSPERRSYYELERLWADAPRLETADHGTKVRAAR